MSSWLRRVWSTAPAVGRRRRSKKTLTSQQKGLALEQRVVQLFEVLPAGGFVLAATVAVAVAVAVMLAALCMSQQAMGKPNVQRSVRIQDSSGRWSEIDVVYGWGPFRRYIECKNYTRPVPLEAVAKFKSVLEMNGIPMHRGLFITTATYTPRARHIGIQCLDGEELVALEAKTAGQAGRRLAVAFVLAVAGAAVGLVATEYYRQLEEERAKAKKKSGGGWWPW